MSQSGFPHSEIPGSKPACGSPRLIAACHVLLRLHVPRHPPYALSSLTIKLTQRISSASVSRPAVATISRSAISSRLTESLPEAARLAKDATLRLTCICPKNFHCQRTPRLNYANLGLLVPAFADPIPDAKHRMLLSDAHHLKPVSSYLQQMHLVGLGRVELPTSPLSGVRSNQLSYRPPGSNCQRPKPRSRT